jgi:16S rRNA (cytosine1402-N4)-methyltransferase
MAGKVNEVYGHVPVLYHEVMAYLQPHPGGRYIDGTVGAGGHALGLLERSAPDGRLLAIDRDREAIAFARRRLVDFGDRVLFVNDSYSKMEEIATRLNFAPVDAILLDLGLSSRQLADPQRGFSFLHEGPLDMRFDPTQETTAGDLLNTLDESELTTLFREYGEEPRSRQIARLIVANRPLTTTTELATLIAGKATHRGRGRIHPATRIFQALRIAVNRELETVETGLKAAVALLRPGGRLAVIAFHSLEDRIVKRFMRRLNQDCICPPEQSVCTCQARATLRLVVRKVIKATAAEIEANPRSRSARLRVAERLAAPRSAIEVSDGIA